MRRAAHVLFGSALGAYTVTATGAFNYATCAGFQAGLEAGRAAQQEQQRAGGTASTAGAGGGSGGRPGLRLAERLTALPRVTLGYFLGGALAARLKRAYTYTSEPALGNDARPSWELSKELWRILYQHTYDRKLELLMGSAHPTIYCYETAFIKNDASRGPPLRVKALLDTGNGGYLVMHKGLADRLGLKPGFEKVEIGGFGGTGTEYSFVRGVRISVAGVELVVDAAIDPETSHQFGTKWADCDIILSLENIRALERRGRRFTSLPP